jgi:hypothetical protein
LNKNIIMDSGTLILLLLVVLAIIPLIFGIKLLMRYKVKRNKKDLIWGLIFTFLIPGIILFFAFVSRPLTMVTYGPGPV